MEELWIEKVGLSDERPEDHLISMLLDDITDRRGWRQEWDGFDNDIQREIVEEWRGIMQTHFVIVKND